MGLITAYARCDPYFKVFCIGSCPFKLGKCQCEYHKESEKDVKSNIWSRWYNIENSNIGNLRTVKNIRKDSVYINARLYDRDVNSEELIEEFSHRLLVNKSIEYKKLIINGDKVVLYIFIKVI